MSQLAAAARRGVGWTTLSVGAGAAGGILQLAIAARFLSREELGLMGLILLVVGLGGQLGDLGTANAVLHHQRSSRSALDSLHWLNVATGFLLFAVASASGPVLARLWGDPGFVRWIPLGAVVLLFAGATQVRVALLQRELRFRALALISILGALASLVAVAALVTSGFGVLALLAGQIAGAASRWLAAAVACRPLFRPRLHFDAREVRPHLGFGVYQLGERLLRFAGRNLDKLVIGTWIGAEALGAYNLAYQLMIRPFGFFASVSSNVTRSVLARIQDEPDRLLRGYLTSVRLAALIALPVYVGAFVTADSLVAVLYGPGWEDVAEIFTLLCPLGALYAIGNPVGGLVVATGKARVSFLWNLFATSVGCAAVVAGVPFGPTGVAMAMLVATAGVIFPCGFRLRWVLVRLRPGPFLACLARPLAYAVIMGAVVHVLTTLLAPLPAAARLGVGVAFGVAVYASLLWTRERTLLISMRGSSV